LAPPFIVVWKTPFLTPFWTATPASNDSVAKRRHGGVGSRRRHFHKVEVRKRSEITPTRGPSFDWTAPGFCMFLMTNKNSSKSISPARVTSSRRVARSVRRWRRGRRRSRIEGRTLLHTVPVDVDLVDDVVQCILAHGHAHIFK
jgi:hypothetical protein